MLAELNYLSRTERQRLQRARVALVGAGTVVAAAALALCGATSKQHRPTTMLTEAIAIELRLELANMQRRCDHLLSVSDGGSLRAPETD